VVHEQTAVPGLANRLAARVARRVAVTFAESASFFGSTPTVVTGNPLRPELRHGHRAAALERFGFDPALPLVYVTGGAQGSHAINRALGDVLPALLAHTQCLHQCGDNRTTGDHAWLQARRAALVPTLAARYALRPWVGDELADVYAAVALVVSRAGAGTVNECCQLGVPALYIPLPGTRGDEQTANARIVERAGGCVLLPQAALTPARLRERVDALLAEPPRLKEMGERARAVAVPDAAERIVALLLEIASP
jgi:UDP-N-acetylglucosamine--N-acetylmuramyl-(pentapeptide) pyrophosphoryl-undecaprenol N-acetylglucosamine transferase